MPYVLRAVEHAECQSREKVPGRQIAGHRTNLEASLSLQKLTDVLQLRNVVLAIATVLDKCRPILQILRDCMLQVEFVQLPKDRSPSFHFFILRGRNEDWLLIAMLMVHRNQRHCYRVFNLGNRVAPGREKELVRRQDIYPRIQSNFYCL